MKSDIDIERELRTNDPERQRRAIGYLLLDIREHLINGVAQDSHKEHKTQERYTHTFQKAKMPITIKWSCPDCGELNECGLDSCDLRDGDSWVGMARASSLVCSVCGSTHIPDRLRYVFSDKEVDY